MDSQTEERVGGEGGVEEHGCSEEKVGMVLYRCIVVRSAI